MKTVDEIGKEFDEVFVPKMNALLGRDMLKQLELCCGPEDAAVIFGRYRACYIGGFLAGHKEIYDTLLK
jgi:hypothetical protein